MDHWKFLAEFAKYECQAGGPDPHMVLSGEMSREESLQERIWRGGCYIAVYNSPYAEMIWKDWPWERVCKRPWDDLLKWLTKNFPRIETRRERRCVRRPEWMLEYLKGYHDFALGFAELSQKCNRSPEENFELVWDRALQVPRLGRYVAIKLLEYYRRYCGLDIRHPDIRPVGGRSPREMLGYLWPDHPQVAEDDDSPEVIALVNKLVLQTKNRLKDEFGVDLDMFKLQVMLCDYKQSWKGKRQYPGRSVDSEMAYALKMEEAWGSSSSIWSVRKEIFPHENLGELNGWSVVRKELGRVLVDYGYTWTDSLYDYQSSYNLAVPARRQLALPKRDYRGVYPILSGQVYQSANWIKYTKEQCLERIQAYDLSGAITLWHHDEQLERLIDWYRHKPIPDGSKLRYGLLQPLLKEALEFIKDGGSIVVMCHAGRNRSGLITTLLVRDILGCTGKRALELVRTARPNAVANPEFEDYLITLGPGVGIGRKPKFGERLVQTSLFD